MKKVFLHGALGDKFGGEWDLDVHNPMEAFRALVANNPAIEKYLFDKQKDGVVYGFKSSPDGEFLGEGEGEVRMPGDIHVFAMPEGAGFLGSLLMMAVTLAATIYLGKKFAEAMERDDSVKAAQTQSYLYQGKENRAEQGTAVPLGYGRLIVGSNVISSAIVNYDFNNENGRIINFNSGQYSVVPTYSRYYIPELGPLGSSYMLNAFDGVSQFRSVDPTFAALSNQTAGNFFGGRETLYGQYVPIDEYAGYYTNADKEEQCSVKGNPFGGYFKYCLNLFKGIDKTLLANVDGGNWHPDPMSGVGGYGVLEGNTSRSSFVCLQSEALLDNAPKRENGERMFFPISFGSDNLDYLPSATRQKNENGVFPIQVGERWRNYTKKKGKEDGVGWFKLESVSIQKTIDLIGEGPIEGFSDENGNTLEFKKIIENPTAELVSVDGVTLRSKDDDYMRAVFLDNTPVKEITNPGTRAAQDSYNVNEFDIDVGMNVKGDMGTQDQTLLEPQYLFTANTTPYGQQLFGPRNTKVTNIGTTTINMTEFVPNTPYNWGDVLTHTTTDSSYNYKVTDNLDTPFEEGSDHKSGDYVYIQSQDTYSFYVGTKEFNKYPAFSGQFVQNIRPYQAGDKVKGIGFEEATKYYEFNTSIDIFKGEYSEDGTYTNGDIVQLPLTNSPNIMGQLFEITGGAVGENVYSRADALYVDQDKIYPMEVLSAAGHATEVDVSPTSTSAFWDELKIDSPAEGGVTVKGVADEDLRRSLFVLYSSSDGTVLAKSTEEYSLSHTVINPLVEEVIVTLKVDELLFVYPGDEVDVEYMLGPFWAFVLALMAGVEIAKGVAKAGLGTGLAAAGLSAGAGATVAATFPLTLGPIAPPFAGEAVGLGEAAAAAGVGAGINAAWAAVVSLAVIAVITLKWWKVGTKVENSGETWPNRARFRIKYGNEAEIPFVTDINIYGVATSPYLKDIKLYMPPNPSQKDRIIKVFKLNYERNPVKEGEMAARYKEKLSLGSVTEIVPTRLNYSNSVVIGTRVNAKDVPSIPKRTYNLKLKKVAIPSNYNGETRKYEGNWNGKFMGQTHMQDEPSKHWTDNPAWCLYDLISSQRYGVAKFGLRPENIDKWTLYKIAKYCDQKIPTGYSSKYPKREFEILGGGKIKITAPNYELPRFKTEFARVGKQLALFYADGSYDSIKIKSFSVEEKTITLDYEPEEQGGVCAVSIDYPLLEPRYTFNGMLMSRQNAFKVISEFAQIFRAYAYWAGGAINFFQDEEKEPVMLFSNNNISEEGFNYSSTPKTSRTNSCKIRYTDKYNKFRAKIEVTEDTSSIRDNNIIEQTIDGFGITSPGQAKRASEFLVKTANLETELISFKTSVIGSYLRPGDVVSVLDSKRTVGRFAGKVLDFKVSGDGKAAEVDIDFPIRAIIDPGASSTWKTINIYSLSGNQTIGSLNAIADNGSEVTDGNIDDLRATQIGQYSVSDITHNDTKLHLRNNPYSFIEGDYTWAKALRAAEAEGGILGTVNNSVDQGLIEAILPNDERGWIGGYYRNNPQPDQFTWFQPQNCTSDEITHFNWAEGFPKVGEPFETDSLEPIITDSQVGISTDSPIGFGSYLAVSGSSNSAKHGGWVTLSGVTKMGYILEKKADDSLMKIDGAQSTTFALEDSVNLANPDSYRVINITEESVGVFKIQGIQYNSGKFGDIDNDLSLKEPESPLIFTEQPLGGPTNVEIGIFEENGYGLKASWDKVQGAGGYRVQFFNGLILLATFEIEADTGTETTQSYSYRGAGVVEDGEYFTRVYALTR